MIYSCKEHIDIAIEEAIDENGMPPQLEEVLNDKEFSTVCFMCEEQAKYKVSG
ncbi:CxxH/CxxC protein [Bacillus shivajii]|uniref:CxxH/CxxC protein n=1 Tax=Bacillus shivajii TaxID=1983719 RepID=UPI001CFBC885|nr:CxxH/CxxC protein [Bacillus shivajii]UCZ53219.1 CxxH/CxxC protein [Bacillus shivajii]